MKVLRLCFLFPTLSANAQCPHVVYEDISSTIGQGAGCRGAVYRSYKMQGRGSFDYAGISEVFNRGYSTTSRNYHWLRCQYTCRAMSFACSGALMTTTKVRHFFGSEEWDTCIQCSWGRKSMSSLEEDVVLPAVQDVTKTIGGYQGTCYRRPPTEHPYEPAPTPWREESSGGGQDDENSGEESGENSSPSEEPSEEQELPEGYLPAEVWPAEKDEEPSAPQVPEGLDLPAEEEETTEKEEADEETPAEEEDASAESGGAEEASGGGLSGMTALQDMLPGLWR